MNKIFYFFNKYIIFLKIINILILNIKYKVFITLLLLILFRIGCFIPFYGINLYKILYKINYYNKSYLIIQKFSLFSIGIMPYISSFMLINFIFNFILNNKKYSLEDYKFKLNKYSIILTLLFSFFYSILNIINIPKLFLINFNKKYEFFFSLISLMLGTYFLIWISKQIENYGIGNSNSMIMFFNIISCISNNLFYLKNILNKKLLLFKIFKYLIILYLLIFISIYIEFCKKKIYINYPKQYIFNKYINNTCPYFYIKINTSGINTLLFSKNILSFLIFLLNYLNRNIIKNYYLFKKLNFFINNNIIYNIIYILLLYLSCNLYINLIFNNKEISNNLLKSGSYILGIKPGFDTEIYINKIFNNIINISFLYVLFIYLFSNFFKYLNIDSTSLLILVNVVIEIVEKLKSIIIFNKYKFILNNII